MTQRAYLRSEWVQYYGRSFRRIFVSVPYTDCTHEHAVAYLGEKRKDQRYSVDVECSCGAMEKYEIGTPLRETPYPDLIPTDTDIVEVRRDSYEVSRRATVDA